MKLPIAEVVRPMDLGSATNGQLADTLLVSHTVPGWKAEIRAHRLAMRSYRALADGCQRATGILLSVTSPPDAYRTFDQQLAMFKDRYVEASQAQFDRAGKEGRRYDGKLFVKKNSKLASAASPGTSNHGWGLAFDVATFEDGKIRRVADSGAWSYFRDHAESFGFSWELQSEPWHVRLVTGDDVPASVREHDGDDDKPVGEKSKETTETGARGDLIVDAPPFEPFDLHRDVSDAHRVRWLQAILGQRGWGDVAVSGTFDDATESAVKVMQRALGVDDDGRYGRLTALALSEFLHRPG